MVAQDYTNRANYISFLSQKGPVAFRRKNETQAGPFKIRLGFLPPNGNEWYYPNFGDIHSISISALMQTNVPLSSQDDRRRRRRRLETSYEWKFIDIEKTVRQFYVDINGRNLYTDYELIYTTSIAELESIWIKTDLTDQWKFTTVIKYFFNATEYGQSELNLLVQCPISVTRPKTVSGSYSSTEVTALTSTSAGQVDIDLSITATLLPCVDSQQSDPNSCIRKTPSDPDPEYKLNDLAKFELYLDNDDFAKVYYLIKNTIQLKTDTMTGYADFTAATTAGPISQGYMTFIVPMAIVGDPITVSAIATLSTTATSRRMMASGASKATFASSDVHVETGAANSNVSGLSSYLMSIVLLLSIILIMV